MSEYFMAPSLGAILDLAVKRMRRGLGCSLLLTGPPGGGKTSFARELAKRLEAGFHYYSGSPDRERDLLYEVDVKGVLERKNAWIPGPAWQAFQESSTRSSVLLIDEVDKTHPGFDAFLLRLLEEWSFRSPGGETITANPFGLAVVLTSNGRRALRPEVLRRCQRIALPLPTGERLKEVIRSTVPGTRIPQGLLDLLIRLGDLVGNLSEEDRPSPKEVGLCAVDLLNLAADSSDQETFQLVATSWLVKGGGLKLLEEAAKGFRWGRALLTEASRE